MNKVTISDNRALLNTEKIHRFLTEQSTWAQGINYQTVKNSIEHSVCIGAYLNDVQVGFCRVITDRATFGNLVDVIVWPEFRGNGISKLLMQAVIEHDSVQGLRRLTLATSNAHGLYQQFGFTGLSKPETFMERYDPDVYKR